MALFAATIFLGSILLFQVELIIARIVLPWFGGAAAVWTTCLLFFQIMLLLGYLYAHGLVRYFRPKTQFLIHLALLVAAAFLLPILPDASWKPAGTEAPLLRILTLLTAVVGLSFFLLSSTSPLLSYWFARNFPESSPYRLYALSNLGSMLGLLSYPTLVEPNLTIRAQAYEWSGAFLAFSAMCALASGKGTFKSQRTSATPPDTAVEEEAPPPPGAEQWFFWIALPASSSVLLLGVTNHLTQNVAAIPFLWVLPLSLYLLSFTLAFCGPTLYPRDFYMPLLAVSILGMEVLFITLFVVAPLKILLPVFCIGLFAGCMVCHGELARMAPDPRYLTRYYLAIAAGGALGGLFVGVAAPLFFRTTYELPLGIAACAILALVPRFRRAETTGTTVTEALQSGQRHIDRGRGYLILRSSSLEGAPLLDRNAGCQGRRQWYPRDGTAAILITAPSPTVPNFCNPCGGESRSRFYPDPVAWRFAPEIPRIRSG
jgi:hypothetical protein